MLIDSGESSNSKQIEQFIREKGVRQLDVVIGSHTHSDHVGSMPYLLDAFDVGKYVMSEAGLETRIQKRINAMLEEKDIPCSYVWAGDVIDWDSDCKVTVLSPVPEFDEYSKTDWNEWSLIMRVEYANHSMIFTGDATVRSEQAAMLNNEKYLFDADVLKVPHHGVYNSKLEDYFSKVNMKYAVITCSDKNPAEQKTLDLLTAKGCRTFLTSNGTVHIRSTKSGIDITQ